MRRLAPALWGQARGRQPRGHADSRRHVRTRRSGLDELLANVEHPSGCSGTDAGAAVSATEPCESGCDLKQLRGEKGLEAVDCPRSHTESCICLIRLELADGCDVLLRADLGRRVPRRSATMSFYTGHNDGPPPPRRWAQSRQARVARTHEVVGEGSWRAVFECDDLGVLWERGSARHVAFFRAAAAAGHNATHTAQNRVEAAAGRPSGRRIFEAACLVDELFHDPVDSALLGDGAEHALGRPLRTV